MINDTVLLDAGMKILIEHLGLVEAERFIYLTKRDLLDYTKWRHTLFEGMTMDEICRGAAEAKIQADNRTRKNNSESPK